MKRIGRGKRIWFAVCAVLLIAALGCGLALRVLSSRLLSQQEAERWQGDNKQAYRQISCFLPSSSELDLSGIYSFRYAILDDLTAAGFEWNEDVYPFIDAWSREGKMKISGEKGSTDAPVLAVGGHFFEFHPLRLLDGSYLAEEDLSTDRVLLDEALAWELFGGTALTGMSVQVNGFELVVGGVVERERDSASRRAYTGEKGLFMSWDTYRTISGESGIDCYEVVLPEPVRGYAEKLVADRFPLGEGEELVNTGRFELERLLQLARDLPVAVTAIVEAFRLLTRGRTALEEDVLPKAKESVEEALRVRARRRWEKKHGG